MVLDIDYLILDYRFSIVIPRPPPTTVAIGGSWAFRHTAVDV